MYMLSLNSLGLYHYLPYGGYNSLDTERGNIMGRHSYGERAGWSGDGSGGRTGAASTSWRRNKSR